MRRIYLYRRSVVCTGLLAFLLVLHPLDSLANEPVDDAPTGNLPSEGWSMTFLPVPVEFWDAPEGPFHHELKDATVRLYPQGSFEAQLTGRGGEPIHIPPGNWVWTAEAPGFVSTMTQLITVPEDSPDERRLIVPMTPACHVTLSQDRRWDGLDRLDLVSIDDAAVYPLHPSRDRDLWIPRGNHLAYGLDGGTIHGISSIGFCQQHEEIVVEYPEAPPAERQSLVVTARLPWTFEKQPRSRMVVELDEPTSRQRSAPPRLPDAHFFQGANVVSFFLDVDADRTLELSVRHPWLRTASTPVVASPGTVQEVRLGDLLERRVLDVSVDYKPAREHGSSTLDLRYCGPERSVHPPMVLLSRCGEPIAERALEPGFQTYDFPDLDDGQFLVSALIDGEVIPGLGQRIQPYLEPGSTAEPTAVAELKEMHVYGSLLVEDEPRAGTVHLSFWEGSSIPNRSFPTDHQDQYHLYYFARYPTAGEVQHLPEELNREAPEDLPGLYCCFRLAACGDGGACRTFNLHSTFTGEGRFDIELPGEEVVEVRAIDAETGEPVAGSRILVRPTPTFHFAHGDVLWEEALGMEADTLRMDGEGRVRWLPPAPGRQRLFVEAPGYEKERVELDVPPGETLNLTVELQPVRHAHGTLLFFADDEPVANAHLLAFDEDARAVAACQVSTDGEGRAAPPQACQDHTFLLVHPGAALQVISGTDLVASAALEVKSRSPFPPRVRLVDELGEPVRDAMVQIRLGDLTLTPNHLLAAAAAGMPFHGSNAMGEILLHGLEAGARTRVEVSPWQPYREQWVDISAHPGGEVEIVVEPED